MLRSIVHAFAALGACCSGAVAVGQSPTIASLGFLSEENPATSALAVSADGRVVTGWSNIAEDDPIVEGAYLWTAASGIAGFADASTTNPGSMRGTGLSADGDVVVGYGGGSPNAFRRNRSGTFSRFDDFAFDVSDDGATAVGVRLGGLRGLPIVWRNGETKSLRSAEGSTGVPRAISGDGSTIVGQVGNSACIFREQAPPEYLGSLDGGEQGADANGVSGDGTQIVGSSLTESGHGHAFLWNRREAMLDLGTVDGATGYSSASGISDDGKIIVGSSDNANRPGGLAAVWLERHPRQLFELLLSSGVDLSAWNRLDVVNDVSADGRVLVGDGVLADGSPAGFRVANAPRPANFPPTIDRPEPQRVECSGARNFVTLTARVEDSNPTDRLTVVWFVAGVPVRTERDLIPGQTSTLRYDFPHGETDVHIEASDGTASDRVRTRVTVADTTDPIVVVATDMKSRVDRGKLFATVDLRQPNVSDACDPAPRVTNDAPPNGRFPIGTTKVVWTVRDASGNVVKSVQQVTVVNVNPSADAGPNRVVRTKNVRAKVRLNGTRSGDVDGHALTYRWHAPGVKFANPTAARTSGLFKRGTTRVTLTVTDAAGAKSSDTMTVRVRKVRTARKSASEADQALRTAYANAFSSGASGLEATAGACLLGAMAGDDIGVESLASVEERLAYSSLRLRQAELADLAASQAYESYLSGADEDALVASLYASYAAAAARRDLASEETVDVLVSLSDEE